MGALLHDVGKPPTFRVADRIRFDGHAEEGARMTHGILTRLRFSNDQIEQIEALVANHMRFKDTRQMRESTLKRFLRMENFDEHLELHRLDCLSSNGNWRTTNSSFRVWRIWATTNYGPSRLVTGHDLIAVGTAPGPMFGEDAGGGGRCPARGPGENHGRGAGAGAPGVRRARKLNFRRKDVQNSP